uniref:PKD domain-containing protein n=1 Tax=Candidatus Methanophaga sp. ANME-1 ERB7 TaxID=2759913 RepID=A0A7G9Z3L3_9EURY|nr:hypothetical protein PAHOCELH_00008 [Methanosarcinales archaeon ANME-1 ERB7]
MAKKAIMRKILSCLVIIVILMSAIPFSVFAMFDGNNSTKSESDLPAENIKTILAKSSKAQPMVHVKGEVVNTQTISISHADLETYCSLCRCGTHAPPCCVDYEPKNAGNYLVLRVKIEEIIKESPLTLPPYLSVGELSSFYLYNPSISVSEGDRVEIDIYHPIIAGMYSCVGVLIIPDKVVWDMIGKFKIIDINVASGTRCGKITNWKTDCTSVQLGGKFGAEMEFDNLMAGGYRFKGIVRVRSPTDEEYSGENQPRFVSSSPNNHGKFAGGNTLYVRIPEGAATGKYDVKQELWNVDTNESCDDTGWKENIFTVEDGGAVSEIVFTGTAIEYHEASGFGAPFYWTVNVDKVIRGTQPCSTQVDVITYAAINIPWGYADPNIVEGDKVEVYGKYYEDQYGCGVTLGDSNDYYIKKSQGSGSIKITSVSPLPGTALNAGDTVTFTVNVDYDLGPSDHGKIQLSVNQYTTGVTDKEYSIGIFDPHSGSYTFTPHTETIGDDWENAYVTVKLYAAKQGKPLPKPYNDLDYKHYPIKGKGGGSLLHFDIDYKGTEPASGKGDGTDQHQIYAQLGQSFVMYMFYEEGNAGNQYIIRAYPEWDKNSFILNSDNDESTSELAQEMGGHRYDVGNYIIPSVPGEYKIKVVYSNSAAPPTWDNYNRLLGEFTVIIEGGGDCFETVASNLWKGEYYNNMYLDGSPSMVRNDGDADLINFDWGYDSPSTACGIGSDFFSVRWTRTLNFDSGTWRFTATTDDGMRVYVDGSLVIDKWFNQVATTYTVDIDLTAGTHTIKVEYYENDIWAVAKLSWEKDDGKEVKFTGTATDYWVSGGQIHQWTVLVDEVISGPQPCEDQVDIMVYESEFPPPWGYVDPNLNVGDLVEVYGRYYEGHCSAIHLHGSTEYYIKRDKKADLTFKEFYFTVDSNEITGAKPGQKVSAHLTLLNKGGRDVDKTKVELYIKKEGKDELLASREITNIASGTLGVGFAIPFEAPLSYGIYNIYAMVDPEGLIEEEDENNNKILRILRVNMVQGKVVILPNNYCYLYPVEIIFESKTSGEKYSAFAPYGLYEIYVPPSEYTAYAKPTDNIFLKPKPKNVITPPDTEVDLPVIFNRDIKFKEGEISLESIKENYPDIYNWLENNYELDNEKIKIAGGALVFEGDIEKYRLKVAEFVIDGIGYVLLVAALIKEVPVIVSIEAFLMVAGKETVKEIPKEMLKILGKNIATGGWPDPSDLSTPDPEGNIYEIFVTTLNKDEDIIRTHLFYLNKYAKWEHIHSQKHKYSISDSNVVLQGKVVDDENNALDGVLVEVIQSHGSLLAKAKTDASGAYKLTIPLIIGEYEDEFLIDLKPVKSVHGIVRLSKEGYKTEEIEETFEMGVYNKNFKLEKETENNIIKGHIHLVLPPMDRRTNVFTPTIMLSADGALYKPYINPTLNDGYYEFRIGKQHNKIALTASVYSASPDMVCDEKSIEVNIGSDPSPITKEIDFDIQCYCTVPLEYQEWKLNSPGNLHIYDSEGRHVGINTSTGCVDTEIPNVVYSGPEAYPQTASIFNLSSELRLIVEGTEEGSFDLIGKKKSDEKKKVEFRHVITSFSTRAELNIGPNSNYKMRIDTNNDGHMDFERKPDLVNKYPVGSYISREKSIVKQTITFDASQSYDLDGGIVEHVWDFGDGSTGTGKIITHSYHSSGNYDVTLTVTDNDGSTDTTFKTITVYPETPIQLHTGWNLISLPLPEGTNTASVLSPISGKYSIIWGYDASDTTDHWKKYDPSAPFGNDLTTMEPGKGYWILMTSVDTLPITGTVPMTTDIDLKTGWNLMGYNSLDSQPVADALSSISGNYNIVWTYDASDTSDHWKKYDPSAPFGNDLTTMEPEKGYWILMNSDDTLKR